MEERKYFFSYAREDAEAVLKLATELRAAGAQLWVDQLDLVGGQHWDHAVEEALKACQGLIVALSPASVASRNVMDEVSYALEEEKLVVPILLRSCTIPFRLRRVQRIDFTASYDAGFSQLLRALGKEQVTVIPDISFLSGEHWDGISDVVIFRASVGAKNILCAISLEALRDHFKAELHQPLKTFRQYRPTIEEMARKLIRAQRFEPNGSILIRSQDKYR